MSDSKPIDFWVDPQNETQIRQKIERHLLDVFGVQPATARRISRRFSVTDNCWNWSPPLNGNGYGRLELRRKELRAHRFIYECLVGFIPNGLVLDHLCRNRSCVNPKHLEPVTGIENLLRGNSLGIVNKGKAHCNRGHPYSGDNLFIRRCGRRGCRECRKVSLARYHKRTRAANRAAKGAD